MATARAMMSAMCGRLDLRVAAKGRLAVMAAALLPPLLTPNPMHSVPMVRAEDRLLANWGWPTGTGPAIWTHARSETAATTPAWALAWRQRRGVIPVAGWWEGSWHVTGEDLHLAVLWTPTEHGAGCVILTQEPGIHGYRFERIPIPLTETGALAWLTGGPLDAQVTTWDIRCESPTGQHQTSLFDGPVSGP